MEPGIEGITPDELLHRFEGQNCEYCEAGELERQLFKESPADVCTNCEVPQIRFF